jgi:hypothetical protein
MHNSSTAIYFCCVYLAIILDLLLLLYAFCVLRDHSCVYWSDFLQRHAQEREKERSCAGLLQKCLLLFCFSLVVVLVSRDIKNRRCLLFQAKVQSPATSKPFRSHRPHPTLHWENRKEMPVDSARWRRGNIARILLQQDMLSLSTTSSSLCSIGY